jgi:hypothetical protein
MATILLSLLRTHPLQAHTNLQESNGYVTLDHLQQPIEAKAVAKLNDAEVETDIVALQFNIAATDIVLPTMMQKRKQTTSSRLVRKATNAVGTIRVGEKLQCI